MSGGEVLLTTLGNVVTFTYTGLTNGQPYYYKISAVNGAGEGSLSNERSAIPVTVPVALSLTCIDKRKGRGLVYLSCPLSSLRGSTAPHAIPRTG